MTRSIWRWLTAGGKPKDMPGWVFVVQLLWAFGLLALFLAFIHGADRLDLPSSFGKIPVEAPWLGAVGGLLASLGGISYYSRGRWEARFNYWHPVKPLMAAASGAVACLLIIVLIRTATGGPSPRLDATALDAAAFVFGFAESSFRELIKSVTDVFLKPGSGAAKAKGNNTGSGGSGTPTGDGAQPPPGDSQSITTQPPPGDGQSIIKANAARAAYATGVPPQAPTDAKSQPDDNETTDKT